MPKGKRGIGVANSANSSLYMGNGNNMLGYGPNSGINPAIPQPVLHPFVCQSTFLKFFLILSASKLSKNEEKILIS